MSQDPVAVAELCEFIGAERRGPVMLVTLERPKALNALCDQLTRELTTVLDAIEDDDSIGAAVLTGSTKAFAAGADIKEMQPKGFADVYLEDFITSSWERTARMRKPIIAAVSGYALGGGAELAMMCDFIIASDTAKFGQPEITIGILPGAGGTQRLTRAVGKSKAMDLVLTGRMIDAEEAERSGLVARVVPADALIDEAVAAATTIAGFSRPAVLMAKESVGRAFETPLAEGLRFERRMFHAAFATEGQAEGMDAFLAKRDAHYSGR
ncbi:enoyl-CoA hydratase [Amycolatopsis taiwanensis]|uniref:Probable enoyl-CoA hydratase echA8 n=1 Tax=Amycolatopsis taiwanensis TaxID=342230 RepID=A0A9W6R7M3_9PSEU|nr:enoyl-CoA hydratase [Amycolatopsis taiwanensis]GLY70606.1 enoyl-CoA hydratase [Amycolatopsis taiwanensis]